LRPSARRKLGHRVGVGAGGVLHRRAAGGARNDIDFVGADAMRQLP
jgi:hypothetical protein